MIHPPAYWPSARERSAYWSKQDVQTLVMYGGDPYEDDVERVPASEEARLPRNTTTVWDEA